METVLRNNQFILNRRLLKAIERNDMKDIRRLINLKADLNAKFTINEIINDKILDGSVISDVKKALDFFKSITGIRGSLPDFSLSPLQLAILYGRKEAVIELIVKANPCHFWTNLHLMHLANIHNNEIYSAKSDKEILQLLFDHGADPNSPDIFGITSLPAAILFQKRDDIDEDLKGIEQTLLNGANPNLKDSSALWRTVAFPGAKRAMELILDHAADPMDSDLSVEFHQHIEKNHKLIEAIKSKNKTKVRRLLNRGTISPNIRDKGGLSALHLAVKLENYAITELLLDNGANPNIKSWKNGTTPLFNAVTSNWMNLAELLLKYEANPSIINTNGLSPLYFSIASDNEKMTELLLKYKANPDISRQISILFVTINEVENDNCLKVIENTLGKIKSIATFLKCKGIPINYTLFYQSIEIAERNDKKCTANKIMELLNELTLD